MYESIHGTLQGREATAAVVAAAGIGYRIQIPLSTYERLPALGEAVTLLLHLVVRDDEWRLMGFGTEEERAGFRALLRVNGVGPAVALSVLGGLAPASLHRAIAEGDVAALTRVKGVGKKTAERILVELRDAWANPLPGQEAPGGNLSPGGLRGPAREALDALLALGHRPEEAHRRVQRALKRLDDPDSVEVAELVRSALRG